jgi:hypothetical protein
MADGYDLNMRKNIEVRDTQFCGIFLPQTLGNQENVFYCASAPNIEENHTKCFPNILPPVLSDVWC